jgi:hypothetical protein
LPRAEDQRDDRRRHANPLHDPGGRGRRSGINVSPCGDGMNVTMLAPARACSFGDHTFRFADSELKSMAFREDTTIRVEQRRGHRVSASRAARQRETGWIKSCREVVRGHCMETLRRTAFVAACLLITGSVVSAQTSVSIGVQIGPPPPPRVVYVAPPPPPQPEFVWVEGYWYPVDRHYVWHDGYWTRPPYAGARWISARYERNAFYAGYWQGPSGGGRRSRSSVGRRSRP